MMMMILLFIIKLGKQDNYGLIASYHKCTDIREELDMFEWSDNLHQKYIK